jgi:multicomponent Na+:H+ antiporter subunit C
MDTLLAFLVGGLYAAAIYLVLQRSLGKLILGLTLLTNATNLLVFTVAGVTRDVPPLVPRGHAQPPGAIADPLPQALILTAIVIGFGLLSFFIALAFRTYRELGSDDLDGMRATDLLTPDHADGASMDEESLAPEDSSEEGRGGHLLGRAAGR